MRIFVLISIAVLLATSAGAGYCLTRTYGPQKNFNPCYDPNNAESNRESQQGDAVRSGESGYQFDGQIPTVNEQELKGNDTASAMVAANQAYAESKENEKRSAASPEQRRTNGIALIAGATAGMVGLGLGRYALNYLSKVTPDEARQALNTGPVKDERSRDLGGDHREYIID